ncbi:hypothetical protein N1F89_20325, partial [Aquibium sp. A9E412]|uniref:hypothetical protein n=1 Tax=Aquibium sp. A9E412 TaxID=2976767 RepID=UPI0025AFD819
RFTESQIGSNSLFSRVSERRTGFHFAWKRYRHRDPDANGRAFEGGRKIVGAPVMTRGAPPHRLHAIEEAFDGCADGPIRTGYCCREAETLQSTA